MASRMRKLSIWMISDLSRLISPPPPGSPAAAASAGTGTSSRIRNATAMEPSKTQRCWSIGQILPVSCRRRRFVKTIPRLGPLSISAPDDAPADDEVATVLHDGLPRRDRALGLVEHDLGLPLARRDDRRRRGPVAVAEPRLHAQPVARRRAGNGIDARRDEPIALEVRRRAPREPVGGGIVGGS